MEARNGIQGAARADAQKPALAGIFHAPIETMTVRRVRTRGLQQEGWRSCRPGALTRRLDEAVPRRAGVQTQFLVANSLSRSAMAAFRERFPRPFSSTPMHLTQISSPSFTMS